MIAAYNTMQKVYITIQGLFHFVFAYNKRREKIMCVQ